MCPLSRTDEQIARWEGRDAGWRIAHPPLGDHESTGPELTGTRDERERQLPQIFGRRSMYCRVPRWRAEEYQWNPQSRVVCKETRPRPCTKKGVRPGPALATAAWWQLSCGHRCIDLGKLRGFATRQPRIHPTPWLFAGGGGGAVVGRRLVPEEEGREVVLDGSSGWMPVAKTSSDLIPPSFARPPVLSHD